MGLCHQARLGSGSNFYYCICDVCAMVLTWSSRDSSQKSGLSTVGSGDLVRLCDRFFKRSDYTVCVSMTASVCLYVDTDA